MASTGEVWKLGHRPALDGDASLGARFDSRPNALNFLRLILALEVIVWHAYALPGGTWLPAPVEVFLGDIAVDGFFAISGFLIVRAWHRNPDPRRFLTARAARILPGLWVCLLATTFFVAPLLSTVTTAGKWRYIVANADTWGTAYSVDGGPVLNGSLWSLGFETGCYLVVLAFGVLRLVRPWSAVVLGAGCWLLSAGFAAAGVGGLSTMGLAARCGLMFTAGALAWFYRRRVPVSGRLAAVSAAMVAVGVIALPDYRLIAAPAVAYLVLVGGAWLGRHPRLILGHDLSYGVYIYGFPLQQLLLATGVSLAWGWFALLSVACVVPAAALSWLLVERPALRQAGLIRHADHAAAACAAIRAPVSAEPKIATSSTRPSIG